MLDLDESALSGECRITFLLFLMEASVMSEPSLPNSTARNTIYVALISTIGAIIVAILANWDRLFPPAPKSPPGSTPVLVTESAPKRPGAPTPKSNQPAEIQKPPEVIKHSSSSHTPRPETTRTAPTTDAAIVESKSTTQSATQKSAKKEEKNVSYIFDVSGLKIGMSRAEFLSALGNKQIEWKFENNQYFASCAAEFLKQPVVAQYYFQNNILQKISYYKRYIYRWGMNKSKSKPDADGTEMAFDNPLNEAEIEKACSRFEQIYPILLGHLGPPVVPMTADNIDLRDDVLSGKLCELGGCNVDDFNNFGTRRTAVFGLADDLTVSIKIYDYQRGFIRERGAGEIWMTSKGCDFEVAVARKH